MCFSAKSLLGIWNPQCYREMWGLAGAESFLQHVLHTVRESEKEHRDGEEWRQEKRNFTLCVFPYRLNICETVFMPHQRCCACSRD